MAYLLARQKYMETRTAKNFAGFYFFGHTVWRARGCTGSRPRQAILALKWEPL